MALTKIGTDGIKDDAVTSDKVANAINSSIEANTAKDLTALSASNLTSGTVPDARISASSVTQHATSFDDNNIINDISALALKLNALQNATRYNTNSTYVDTFQDANGIASFTTAARNAIGEYVSSYRSEHFGTLQNFVAANWNVGSLQAKSVGTGTFSHGASPDEDGLIQTMGASTELSFPANTPFQWSLVPDNSSGYGPYIAIQKTSNSASGNPDNNGNFSSNGRKTAESFRILLDAANDGIDYFEINSSGNQNQYINNGQDVDQQTVLFTRDAAGQLKVYRNGSLLVTSTINVTAAMQLAIGGTGSHPSSATSMQYSVGEAEQNNATGNFISNAITASASTSKMGVVITYKDQAGTATLNTDLKVYVSADNGSNFTQVTLVAQPDFSTGVKMAAANDVTVTAGTQLKYKVEFANQSASKETRVTGVSLQY